MAEPSAVLQGAREAAGVPAAVLVAGYTGFGALAAGHGLPLPAVVASTVAVWALPAQLILVEMHTVGAPLLATVLAAMLSSARFLPMTLTLMPMMRHSRHRGWQYLVAAQLLSLTGWAMAMARFPDIAPARRLPWFFGFTLVCIAASAAATVIGYAVADAITPLIKIGLVFLAPAYYLLILLGSVRERATAYALACGAVAGPIAFVYAPQWSVLIAGLAGGTLAYLLLPIRLR
ncbi:MAG: AzlC family ABC transporter permease [Betaproteobacteria bacterium]|nr:AzlC family ABC transporter permease [Betaproteobacteria bacterium]